MKNFSNINEIIKAEDNKKKNIRIYIAALLAVQMLMIPLSGCTSGSSSSASGNTSASILTIADGEEATVTTTSKSSGAGLSADELFTERDLAQNPDLSEAS